MSRGGGKAKLSARAARARIVRRRAKELGISIKSISETNLGDLYNAWIARAFADAPLPKPWSEYSDEEGRIFFYNHISGLSKWEHPLFNTFRGLLERSRLEPDLARHGYFRDLYYRLEKYVTSDLVQSDGGDKDGSPLKLEGRYKGWWALNLLAATSTKKAAGPPPTPDEVKEMCGYVGIETSKESELAWIAKQAVLASLPPDWYEAEDLNGNTFYFNTKTGQSQTSHPLDEYFVTLVRSERKRVRRRIESRKQSLLEIANNAYDPDVASRISIKLYESHWEFVRSQWIPFVARGQKTYWYHFGFEQMIHVPFWEPRFRIAGRKIATAWRAHVAWEEKKRTSALTIQKQYRGFVVRSAITQWRRNCAAICIQCAVRRHLAQRQLKRAQSAIAIQRAFRMYLSVVRQQQHVAATILQSNVRRMIAQKLKTKLRAHKKRVEATLRIQSNIRKMQQRRNEERRRRDGAANAIRSAYCAFTLRREIGRRVERKRILYRKQQEYMKKYRSKMMSRKAVVIQSAVRSFLIRKRVGAQHKAASLIQRTFRAHLIARRRRVSLMVDQYYTQNASMIQSGWRKFASDRAARVQYRHAVTVQKHVRAHLTRKACNRLRFEKLQSDKATTIQRHMKGYVLRRRYQRIKRATLRIQSQYRGFRCRVNYALAKAAAERRVAMMRHIAPYCHALAIEREVIMSEVDPKLPEDGVLLDEKAFESQLHAMKKVVKKRQILHSRAMGEIARICASMESSNLLSTYNEETALLEEGTYGWLSDEAMKTLKVKLKAVHEIRTRNIKQLSMEAQSKLNRLRTDLKISKRWFQKHAPSVLMAGPGGNTTFSLDLDVLLNLITKVENVAPIAGSVRGILAQIQSFKKCVKEGNKDGDVIAYKFRGLPVALTTLRYILSEAKKHRADEYDDIALMLSLPSKQDLAKIESLYQQFDNGEAVPPTDLASQGKSPANRRHSRYDATAHVERYAREETFKLKKRPKRRARKSVMTAS